MAAPLSIVVPVYNVEKYLPACIDSLRGQTLKDIEIILVDDGSPDGSGAICDRAAAEDPRIRVIHKANGGVSAARNDGLAAAGGEYVIFVDSDDYVPSGAYEAMLGEARRTGADMVIGDVTRVWSSREERVHFYRGPFVTSEEPFITDLIRADMYRNYCPAPAGSGPAFGYGGPWNKIVRRAMLTEGDIRFDVRLKGIFDDILYSAHILAAAKKIAYIQENVYCYRMLDTSLTRGYKKNMPEINAGIFTAWREFMDRYGSDGRYRGAFSANVVRRIDESLSKYYFNPNNDRPAAQVRSELKAFLKAEPCLTALREVEMGRLSKRHKALVLAARFRCMPLLKKLAQ